MRLTLFGTSYGSGLRISLCSQSQNQFNDFVIAEKLIFWARCIEGLPIEIKHAAGSRYFCESFYEHPCPTSGKNYATAHACGCPSRPGHSFTTQQGVAHLLSNDSTRCRKACIFTTLKLRENTCTIASGDYSTPVSQRMKSASIELA
jgi:hypothetical protein